MRPALLVIDMQREFLDGKTTTPRLEDGVELIAWVAGLFREKGLPVLAVHDVESCPPGSPGYPFVAGLEPAPSDVVIDKVHGDSFRDTELLDVLRARSVDFLVICGYRAESCVLSTIKGAEAHDFAHCVLRGGVLSPAPDAAAFIERISPLASWQVVKTLVDAAGPA